MTLRGTRSPVLFLRRFGYRGSMQVVTFAVANTIGSSWRLVTLDDAAIAPVADRLTRDGGAIEHALRRFGLDRRICSAGEEPQQRNDEQKAADVA